MQFIENLTDRQAAEAVRGRIDWKYALGLDLTDPGFDFSVLSEFRQRLIEGGVERRLLETLLERCATKGLLGGKKKQRTDSTHVLAAIRMLNLVELVGETMRRVLNDLAQTAPHWLQGQLQPEWIKRYGRPFDSYRLPQSEAERKALADTPAGSSEAPLFKPGHKVTLRITNTQPPNRADPNDPARILNITTLELQSDWSITQIYPAGSGAFEAGEPGPNHSTGVCGLPACRLRREYGCVQGLRHARHHPVPLARAAGAGPARHAHP
ncbi:MAG: hypothetical protein BroJett011_27370 [Chloroflexota bacterium]|nr:MAG: hypothetical protein BroJett011_27370 [Chloroflexota bacterium]